MARLHRGHLLRALYPASNRGVGMARVWHKGDQIRKTDSGARGSLWASASVDLLFRRFLDPQRQGLGYAMIDLWTVVILLVCGALLDRFLGWLIRRFGDSRKG